MGGIFAVDGKLFNLLSKIADLVVLNLLWVIFSIPVVTIGASTTALYSVTLKMVRNEENYVAQSFLHSFKENWKQSTIVWMGILVAGIILYFDFYAVGHAQAMKYITIPILVCALILMMITIYVFPILSYFKVETTKAVKNAGIMSVAYLPHTLAIVVITLIPLVLLFAENLVLSLFIDVVIGISASAFGASFLFRNLFGKVKVVKESL